MTKKAFAVICMCLLLQCKPTIDITKSNDIKAIEQYLQTAHPDDQYRRYLSKKLIKLKNETWMLGSLQTKPMAARPIITDLPKKITPETIDRKVFEELISEANKEHNLTTGQLLNEMFNEGRSVDNKVIVLIKNQSACDMILELKSNTTRKLAIPAKSEVPLIIERGTYELNSTICNVKYHTQKVIDKNILITLNATVN